MIPDANALLMGADPIPACATDSERALLEWAAANSISTPHPGMTKDGSRYSAPDPDGGKAKARTRVTTFCEALDDGEGLVRWRHRLLAHGLNLHRDHLSEVEPGDNAAADKVIGRALHDAGEKLKADIGTAIHLACEHHLTGTGIRPPAPWDADVDAYAAMIAAHQLEPVMTEAVLWVPVGDGLCGTADLLVRGPWGDELRIVDIKTGSSAQRIGYACQLAAYSGATHRWTDDGWAPLPAIDPSVAYIAHVPAGSGTCELLAVTLDHGLVDLAAQVRERRKVRNVAAMFTAVEAPPSLFDAEPEQTAAFVNPVDFGADPTGATDSTAAFQAAADAARTDLDWIDNADPEAMRAWFVDRVRAVSKHGDGLALARRWPSGMDSKQRTSWTAAQMAELHEVLATLEVAAGLEPEFPPTVPVDLGRVELGDPPRAWEPDEGDGPIDSEAREAVKAGWSALDAAPKEIAASWVRGGRIGGRHWAVAAKELTPRKLAIFQAALACLQHVHDGDDGDTDLLVRAALALVTDKDPSPGWETGALLGALTIDQARRLAEVAVAFGTDDHTAGEVGAKALALTAPLPTQEQSKP